MARLHGGGHHAAIPPFPYDATDGPQRLTIPARPALAPARVALFVMYNHSLVFSADDAARFGLHGASAGDTTWYDRSGRVAVAVSLPRAAEILCATLRSRGFLPVTVLTTADFEDDGGVVEEDEEALSAAPVFLDAAIVALLDDAEAELAESCREHLVAGLSVFWGLDG